jgi:5-(carboxyamino)imidazole ribonucleotide synthase
MRVGILGAGQLGRMLALSAIERGHSVQLFTDVPSEPCAFLGDAVAVVDYHSPQTWDAMVAASDVITCEFENIPHQCLKAVESRIAVFPTSTVLQTCSDRLLEKQFFQSLGIPVAPFGIPESIEEIEQFIKGDAAILKTRRLGYDGLGQTSLPAGMASAALFNTLQGQTRFHDYVLERRLKFDAEFSIIGARDCFGKIVFLPLVRNVHEGGILRFSAPLLTVRSNENRLGEYCTIANLTNLETRAREYLRAILEAFDYRGVMALELFLVEGQLIANECAPRVHNSGHWSLGGALFSQFDAHVQAVCGAALPDSLGPFSEICMGNVIGTWGDKNWLAGLPGAKLYDYGKGARKGRKLGHVNFSFLAFEDLLASDESTRSRLLEYFSLPSNIFDNPLS